MPDGKLRPETPPETNGIKLSLVLAEAARDVESGSRRYQVPEPRIVEGQDAPGRVLILFHGPDSCAGSLATTTRRLRSLTKA